MADLKNTVIDDAGFLQLPVGTTGQRPTPAAGQMRFNTNAGKAEFYNAATAAWVGTAATGVIATGGVVYDTDVEGTTYRVHVFATTGNSTFAVTRGGEAEYLIVAGGGGGGAKSLGTSGGTAAGAGGGAGGLLTGITTLTPQAYTITVGAGGTGGGPTANGGTGSVNGTNGSNTVALGLTAIGGGFGRGNGNGRGGNGGSGGGSNGTSTTGGDGTAGQGNDGGGDGHTTSGSPYPRAGGGGAGEAGGDANSSTGDGGKGGNGLISTLSGISTFYAGGGGGAAYVGVGGGAGQGGGTKGGAPSEQNINNPDATPNTGGGGGGQGGGSVNNQGRASRGGSGIVIVRYPLRQANPVSAAGKVVGDGVVLDLDFAKPTVYSGTGTTVADSRLNGKSGTLENGPVFRDARTHRSNFEFDGGNDWISLPGVGISQWSQPFTMECWFYIPTGAVWTNGFLSSIFSTNGSYSGMYGLARWSSEGQAGLYVRGNNGGISRTASGLARDRWHHLVGVWTGSQSYIITNGVASGSGGSARTGVPDSTNLNLGLSRAFSGNTGAYFGGRISVARYYNRALLSEEAIQSFNANSWRFGV